LETSGVHVKSPLRKQQHLYCSCVQNSFLFHFETKRIWFIRTCCNCEHQNQVVLSRVGTVFFLPLSGLIGKAFEKFKTKIIHRLCVGFTGDPLEHACQCEKEHCTVKLHRRKRWIVDFQIPNSSLSDLLTSPKFFTSMSPPKSPISSCFIDPTMVDQANLADMSMKCCVALTHPQYWLVETKTAVINTFFPIHADAEMFQTIQLSPQNRMDRY